ncbi:S8 family serine peptidase [Nannocystis pusilla]|uniref:S8 family serine peptidase n=1 Tax=Nannocystis pusilla TaxID=889268 RepID=A0ABS7U037_9BACT|nr:S8 family serine peptidase [Nannocystis pusilla]
MNGILGLPGVTHVRVLRPGERRLRAFDANGFDGAAASVHVIEANEDTASRLKLQASVSDSLLVEEDAALRYGAARLTFPAAVSPADAVTAVNFRFRVLGSDDSPVSGAQVNLRLDCVNLSAVTDAAGIAEIAGYVVPGSTVQYLQILPQYGYWDLYAENPSLRTDAANEVRLASLAAAFPGFPQGFRHGWGQKMMGLDQLTKALSGRGVRIAVVDSGADRRHPQLGHLRTGLDFTDHATADSWATDDIGHGTHCAGIIGAAGQSGLVGFAPEAEIHVLKIFPDGRVSGLLDALEYCIEEGIDLVNLSLGTDAVSELVESRLAECVAHGVACVVAAGNSGGPVQFPARSRHVLAVAAVGAASQVQPWSWDVSQYTPQLAAADGVFSPLFSCYGREVAVAAPGVGIVSTYPGGSYKPESGTSMAAPHVTGLAALLLAHHTDLRTGSAAQRGPARVQQLFTLVRDAARNYPFGAERVGAGVPTLDGLEEKLDAAPAARATEAPALATASAGPRAPGRDATAFLHTLAASHASTPAGQLAARFRALRASPLHVRTTSRTAADDDASTGPCPSPPAPRSEARPVAAGTPASPEAAALSRANGAGDEPTELPSGSPPSTVTDIRGLSPAQEADVRRIVDEAIASALERDREAPVQRHHAVTRCDGHHESVS